MPPRGLVDVRALRTSPAAGVGVPASTLRAGARGRRRPAPAPWLDRTPHANDAGIAVTSLVLGSHCRWRRGAPARAHARWRLPVRQRSRLAWSSPEPSSGTAARARSSGRRTNTISGLTQFDVTDWCKWSRLEAIVTEQTGAVGLSCRPHQFEFGRCRIRLWRSRGTLRQGLLTRPRGLLPRDRRRRVQGS